MEALKNFHDRFSMLLHIDDLEIKTGDEDLRLLYVPTPIDLKDDFTMKQLTNFKWIQLCRYELSRLEPSTSQESLETLNDPIMALSQVKDYQPPFALTPKPKE